MVKNTRESIKERLRWNGPGTETKRINYFKLNQGYDVTEDDSEYVNDQDSYKAYKKIKKEKFKNKKERVIHDNLEVLLDWKRTIKCQPIETDAKKVIVPKKILGTDLSQYAKNIQGIFINLKFRKDLKLLDLSKKVISNGIVFIWSDKNLIIEILETMEGKGFIYIENLVVVQLSVEKALTELNKHMQVEQTEDAVLDNLAFLQTKIQVKDLIDSNPYKLLNQSKKVLIMFRKFDEQKSSLELRHQRTPDVLFDLVKGNQLSIKTKEYIYQTIETLLPKSQLMEIFASKERPRKGWVSICGDK